MWLSRIIDCARKDAEKQRGNGNIGDINRAFQDRKQKLCNSYRVSSPVRYSILSTPSVVRHFPLGRLFITVSLQFICLSCLSCEFFSWRLKAFVQLMHALPFMLFPAFDNCFSIKVITPNSLNSFTIYN